MTEAKEIAEDTPRGKALGIVHWYGRIQQTPRAPYAQELADAIEQAIISYAAERESAFEDLQADYGNDLSYLKALKESARQLRDLFAKHGVDKHLNWPEWFAAIESRLSSRPATEGKGD